MHPSCWRKEADCAALRPHYDNGPHAPALAAAKGLLSSCQGIVWAPVYEVFSQAYTEASVNVLMLAPRKEWDPAGVGFGSGPLMRGTKSPI